jgi:hypothetical protein
MVESWEQKTEPSYRPRLLLNRIRTPDGTVLTSYTVHDYRTYTDVNGLEYMVDGGLEYLRRNVHENAPYEELSVTDEADHEQQREAMCWGTYGKYGDQPLHYVPICKMADGHIKAIIEHNMGADWVRQILQNELDYRVTNNISITD